MNETEFYQHHKGKAPEEIKKLWDTEISNPQRVTGSGKNKRVAVMGIPYTEAERSKFQGFSLGSNQTALNDAQFAEAASQMTISSMQETVTSSLFNDLGQNLFSAMAETGKASWGDFPTSSTDMSMKALPASMQEPSSGLFK